MSFLHSIREFVTRLLFSSHMTARPRDASTAWVFFTNNAEDTIYSCALLNYILLSSTRHDSTAQILIGFALYIQTFDIGKHGIRDRDNISAIQEMGCQHQWQHRVNFDVEFRQRVAQIGIVISRFVVKVLNYSFQYGARYVLKLRGGHWT